MAGAGCTRRMVERDEVTGVLGRSHRRHLSRRVTQVSESLWLQVWDSLEGRDRIRETMGKRRLGQPE